MAKKLIDGVTIFGTPSKAPAGATWVGIVHQAFSRETRVIGICTNEASATRAVETSGFLDGGYVGAVSYILPGESLIAHEFEGMFAGRYWKRGIVGSSGYLWEELS